MRYFTFLIFICLSAFGKEVLCIDNTFIHNNTFGYQLVFEDTRHEFSFETIDSIPFESSSLRSTKETTSVFWLKTQIKNCSLDALNIIFKHPRPGLDYIDAYLFEENELVAKHRLGDMRDASKRQIPYRNSLFVHILEPNHEYTLITKLYSYGPYELYWSLEDAGYFAKQGSIETIVWGIFIGILIALCIYNLILYLTIKERAFLMYVFHIASIAIYQTSNSGILYHYLSFWIDVKLLTVSVWVFPYLSLAFLLLFAYDFFYLKSSTWGKILQLSTTLSFCIAVFYSTSFWNMDLLYNARYLTPFSLAIPLLIIALSLSMIYQKKFAAFYFFIGQSIYIFSILYYILSISGFIQMQSYTWLIVIFGILCDLVFLSLALGKRISHVQKESSQQAKLIAEQSRFALVGQTVGNIAHQWKAPVSKLTSQLMFLQATFIHQKNNFLSEFEKMIPEMNSNIEFIQKNIDLFYNFYKYSDEEKWFNPIDEIKTIEIILENRLTLENITCQIGSDIKMLKAHKSAFKNIVMICFENAANALIKREGERLIKITIRASDHKNVTLLFKDNAPLLKQQYQENKKSDDGCGIGLSLAKMLSEKQLKGNFKFIKTQDNWTTFELIFNAESI